MAQHMKVSYAELAKQAGSLRRGREEIVQRIDALQREIAGLVSSGFVTDKTSVAFNSYYQDFARGARTTVTALDGLAEFLDKTAATLTDVDRQLAAKLAR
ncbi:WXG100 family type VII secretion target [Rarobacter incanus]|uniref:WXG100 family type VII secretion target n=1 Tax=Rarobacter incanus TaxID=153494 RepID=A0A542SRM4_9MICO|nr:WXG100 family type VII secretion target [Rarobacter incanus]TQK77270.1 WXG100 family type VII secretion target [Rarobacter incanus]